VAILFGVERETGLYAAAGLSAVLLLPGGQRSLVWTQAMQAMLMAAGCLAAIGILAGSAEPSIGASIAGAVLSLRTLLAIQSEGGGLAGFLLPVVLVAAGTGSLPLLLTRTLSARSPREAARSMSWALLGAVLFVAGGLTLAAFLDSEAGVQIGGFLAGDLLQQGTLLGVLPSVGSGILLAGALAALLAIGQAALLAAAATLSHDIWDETLDRRGPAGRRIIVARLCIVAVAAVAVWLEPQVAMSPFALVSWALAFCAAGLVAPLVLGLWWRGCTPLGATLGIAAGLGVVSLFLFLYIGGSPGLDRIAGDAGVGPLAATGFAMAANFLVALAVSVLRASPAGAQTAGRFAGRRTSIAERPA
jgi:Na+(H+)/acetate symporter ActP